jgi:hypothetical protein
VDQTLPGLALIISLQVTFSLTKSILDQLSSLMLHGQITLYSVSLLTLVCQLLAKEYGVTILI